MTHRMALTWLCCCLYTGPLSRGLSRLVWKTSDPRHSESAMARVQNISSRTNGVFQWPQLTAGLSGRVRPLAVRGRDGGWRGDGAGAFWLEACLVLVCAAGHQPAEMVVDHRPRLLQHYHHLASYNLQLGNNFWRKNVCEFFKWKSFKSVRV